MNITDSIIDKILYKEFVASGEGFTKEYKEVDNIRQSNVVVFNTLFKIGGSVNIRFFHRKSDSTSPVGISPSLQIYVNEELKYTDSTNSPEIEITFPPFAKVKAMASTATGTMRTQAILEADLVDKQDMYFVEVVE